MTAEVAILNHNAVALAADSAASLIDDTGAVSKVYNSLTKIHAPIVAEPFGVMFYGDVHFAGILGIQSSKPTALRIPTSVPPLPSTPLTFCSGYPM